MCIYTLQTHTLCGGRTYHISPGNCCNPSRTPCPLTITEIYQAKEDTSNHILRLGACEKCEECRKRKGMMDWIKELEEKRDRSEKESLELWELRRKMERAERDEEERAVERMKGDGWF